MKRTTSLILNKWKIHAITIIGGLLMGAGFADCLYALNVLDLNQLARGLTIFSAGLTIIVVMDNLKLQKANEKSQLDNQLQLEKIEQSLAAIQQSQQITENQLEQLREIIETVNVKDSL